MDRRQGAATREARRHQEEGAMGLWEQETGLAVTAKVSAPRGMAWDEQSEKDVGAVQQQAIE